MPDPRLSEAAAALLRAETFAPLIESALRAIAVHVSDGTLPDDRLDALLAWYETGKWSGCVESEDLIAMFKSSCKLSSAQRRQCKALAAQAIARQHGGRYPARDYVWRSDGFDLWPSLPGGME